MSSTKEKILNAALTLFSSKGYSGTSMQDIADEVGITKAALYKHYEGKEQLLNGLLSFGEEYYANNVKLNAHNGDLDVPKNENEFVTSVMNAVTFTISDETIIRLRKLLCIEQFRSDIIADTYSRHSFTDVCGYYKKVFEKMIAQGTLKKNNPNYLAADLTTTVSCFIGMADRHSNFKSRILCDTESYLRWFYSVNS